MSSLKVGDSAWTAGLELAFVRKFGGMCFHAVCVCAGYFSLRTGASQYTQ